MYLRYKDVRPIYVGITKDVDIRAVQLGEMFDKIVRITEELLNCGHAWIREPEIIQNNPHF